MICLIPLVKGSWFASGGTSWPRKNIFGDILLGDGAHLEPGGDRETYMATMDEYWVRMAALSSAKLLPRFHRHSCKFLVTCVALFLLHCFLWCAPNHGDILS